MTPNLWGRLATAAVLAIALAGCVTTPDTVTGAKPDLKEAARLNTQLGIDYMRQGEMNLALEKLRRALDQDPDLAIAHSYIAFVYARQGENKLAEKHYREALSLDSKDSSVLNNFGVFLCGQGKTAEAEKYFLRATDDKHYPTPEAAWTNAGVCVQRVPDLNKAERYFREALKINPEFPDALAQMAWLSYQKQDYLRARAFMQRFERVGKATPETLWLGAQTERKLGDKLAAMIYERRLRTEFPEADPASDFLKKTGKP